MGAQSRGTVGLTRKRTFIPFLIANPIYIYTSLLEQVWLVGYWALRFKPKAVNLSLVDWVEPSSINLNEPRLSTSGLSWAWAWSLCDEPELELSLSMIFVWWAWAELNKARLSSTELIDIPMYWNDIFQGRLEIIQTIPGSLSNVNSPLTIFLLILPNPFYPNLSPLTWW